MSCRKLLQHITKSRKSLLHIARYCSKKEPGDAEKRLEVQLKSELFKKPIPSHQMILIEEEVKRDIFQKRIKRADIRRIFPDLVIEPKTGLRRQEVGKVHLGFIPEEWILFFRPKTGVTGFYTFLTTVGTYLCSKEIYILEHNFYNGLSMAVLFTLGVKFVGPHLAKYLDDEIDEYEVSLIVGKLREINNLLKIIEDEQDLQWRNEGQLVLIEAKRENVQLQLEAEYRNRQMLMYTETKNRLDYQIAVGEIMKRFTDRNLYEWVIKEVKNSLPPDLKAHFLYMSVYEWVDIINKNKDVI